MTSHKFSFFKSSISVLIISLLVLGIFGLMKNTSQAKKFINFEMLKANEFSIKELYYNNKHFAHYDAAFKIFLNYPIFGIGINNFGNENKKEKYKSNKFSHTDQSSSTHPHQVYFEILAEFGLFGFLYIVLINFWITIKGIKLYFKEKSFSLLGNLMLHIFFLYPILPSGSFFGTNYGLPYWFNFSILVYQIYLKKIK